MVWLKFGRRQKGKDLSVEHPRMLGANNHRPAYDALTVVPAVKAGDLPDTVATDLDAGHKNTDRANLKNSEKQQNELVHETDEQIDNFSPEKAPESGACCLSFQRDFARFR